MHVLTNTAYLPPVQYMAALSGASVVSIEVMETYRKQTCRNHCVIYGPNGKQTLTIPVTKVNGNHTMTRDMRISNDQPWQKTHWRSIKTAYNNSPFFLYYGDYFAPFYAKKYDFLVDFNFEILTKVIKLLKIPVNLQVTTSYTESSGEIADLRDVLVAGNNCQQKKSTPYTQVFEPVHGFIPGLSVLDVICNLGPESAAYLKSGMLRK
jgi:hypothetical protein